jgi:hypothetical protein
MKNKTQHHRLQPEIKKPTRAKRTVVAKPTVSEPGNNTTRNGRSTTETIEIATFTLDNNR